MLLFNAVTCMAQAGTGTSKCHEGGDRKCSAQVAQTRLQKSATPVRLHTEFLIAPMAIPFHSID